MTHGEIRDMLRRVNARQLREDAGISPRTVQRALGITRTHLSVWERGKHPPTCEAGVRWARFVSGLARHAEVSAEIAARERRAA